MRCKILCLESKQFDLAAITNHLQAIEYDVSFETIGNIEQAEALLREKSFDIFLMDGDDTSLLDAAKLLKKTILLYKLSSLFMMQSENHGLRPQLLEKGISQVIVACDESMHIANIMDLVLQRDRCKSELAAMGGYMRDASLVFDPKGSSYEIAFVNKAFLDLDGLKQEDVVGSMVEEVESCFNLTAFLDDIKEVDATGVPAHMPNYFYMNEEAREWCDVYIYKPNSQQISLIASPQTEIKRTHDKAEASRRYLQTILNAQAHIIYITDGDRLINTNKAFLNFFGFQTMHDFTKKHDCVSSLFEESNETGYIDSHSKNWLDEVAGNPDDIYKIRIKKGNNVVVFIPSVQEVLIDTKKQHVVILTDITELEDEKEKLRVVAMTDQLTGAANRFKFNTVIDEQFAISRRYGSDLGMIIFDVDNFKEINDSFSHQVGDAVLKTIAAIVKSEIRESDLFIRWGGEEFMIILPNTSLEHSEMAARKIQKSFESHSFETVENVTCSFGCVALKADDTIASMIYRADEAMYQAKKSGRNCIRVGL